ncbi:MAG: TlyA family RNA methyltransferase [Proteobacteria bacterium]|nr:TlyA family RNA methyltransferase [Pseudomonadota bacterium]
MSNSKKKHLTLVEELIRRGLAKDQPHATGLILSGQVVVNDQRVDKIGSHVTELCQIRLKNQERFVSRGGDKLLSAIEALSLTENFKDKTVLDIGSSTGGFTDCVLQLGATKVIAVDVGTNQLAWKLRNNPRVMSFEKTDIRDYIHDSSIQIDWVVADISFNSLTRVTKSIVSIAPSAKLLLLIKPQFELPAELVPEGGVVLDEADRELAVASVSSEISNIGYQILGTIDSAIKGRTGNQEIFIYCAPTT